MKALPDPHPDTPSLQTLRDAFAAMPPDRTPSWGRMNAAQMLQHCRDFNRLCLGDIRPGLPIRLIARLAGPMFLRKFLAKSPTDGPKNLKTLAEIRADGAASEVESARTELLESLDRIAEIADPHRHPLYGRSRAQDVQAIARHHMAHHAHQFGIWPKG